MSTCRRVPTLLPFTTIARKRVTTQSAIDTNVNMQKSSHLPSIHYHCKEKGKKSFQTQQLDPLLTRMSTCRRVPSFLPFTTITRKRVTTLSTIDTNINMQKSSHLPSIHYHYKEKGKKSFQSQQLDPLLTRMSTCRKSSHLPSIHYHCKEKGNNSVCY